MPLAKKFTAEQIIGKLRKAEVGLAHGKTVPGVVRKRVMTEQSTDGGSESTSGCGLTKQSG
jgi:hypothetical protein